MSSNKNEFNPDTNVKKSYLGKIFGSLLFILIGAFFAYSVFHQYNKLLIPTLIILVTGVILLTIWVDGLYIYRYLLPAMIIILVFTVYPIGYTVFIAFTNYGTGHLMVKEDAKAQILRGKWIIDYNEKPLYAEFFVSDDYVEKFNKVWNIERAKFVKEVEKAKENYFKNLAASGQKANPDDIIEDDIKEVLDIKDRWYDVAQPKIIDDMLSKVKIEDFKVIAYNSDEVEIQVKADEDVDLKKKSKTDEEVVVTEKPEIIAYTGMYTILKDTKEQIFELKPESFDNLDSFVSGMTLISDKVRKIVDTTIKDNDTAEDSFDSYEGYKDEFYAESYTFNIRDFSNLLDNLRENIPLALYVEEIGDYKRFLNSIGNEFMRKMKGFTLINNEIYMLVDHGNGLYKYSKRVFEDDYLGSFVVTKDDKDVNYWKEYAIKSPDFNYGIFSISSNSEVERYLTSILNNEGIFEKINSITGDSVVGKPIDEVNSSDIKKIKLELNNVNKYVNDFNKRNSQLKKDYYQMKKIELSKIDEAANSKINTLEKEVIELKKNMKELKKLPKSYKTYMDINNITIRLNVITTQVRQQKKEIRGRKTQLNKIQFPYLNKAQLVVKVASNVDYEQNIEPGFVATIGMRNFTKIFATRNITAPFMRVFLWTVLWSFFSVVTAFAVGLALALVFNAGDLKGRFFYRTLFILPYAIPSFVSVLMWSGFLNDEFGVINLALGLDIPWLQDPSGIMPKISCILVNLWLSFPYMMIISLGALQSIDDSMYEAADVDGASKFQQFWGITLPLLLIALGPMLVGSFAFAFNNFAGIYLLNAGGPVMASGVLPGHTDILISYTYKLAFGPNQTDYGLASAIGIIVFFIIGSITFFNFKFTGTFKEVDNA
ncbi:MAG: hypothetical protein A2015_00225 [Spirochaetes bacterium GWF1_31_7]|nr:MAG: hypothetical protein A2Y30_04285 [Spirochaetes bacterium GWE1_32_154]OHD45991.1 MAG: hypothetical protein A2Y29_07825 [Spirochaetes bacterium GWE2_31_10]OHD51016.1 MAG: hypothetical protein A2015_00225 [Spirochaetes bacterium GWF1_31_7]HBD94331.1 hypothetical protein [Spirochaetia bacterium]